MFDLYTIGIMYIFSTLLFFGLSTMLYRLLEREESLLYFTLMGFSLTIGLVFILMRGIAPDFFSYVLSNTFIALALGFLSVASRKLCGTQGSVKWHWLAAGVMFVLFFVFTYLWPSLKMRYVAQAFVLGSLLIVIGLTFLRCSSQDTRTLDVMTTFLAFVGVPLFIVRVFVLDNSVTSADAMQTDSFFIAGVLLYGTMLNVWFATVLAIKVSLKLQKQVEMSHEREIESHKKSEQRLKELNEELQLHKEKLEKLLQDKTVFIDQDKTLFQAL